MEVKSVNSSLLVTYIQIKYYYFYKKYILHIKIRSVMELLRELVRFVGPQNLRKIEIFSKNDLKPSNLQKLYKGIAAMPKASEAEVVQQIFGTTTQSSTYRQLKFKLKKKLINNLFLIDPNEAQFNTYTRSYVNGRRLVFAANILYTLGARKSANILAQKAFRVADKYSQSDIALEALTMLWNMSLVMTNRKKASFYADQYDKYLAMRIAESKAIKYFFTARRIQMDNRDYEESDIDDLIEEGTLALEVESGNFHSANFTLYTFSMLCILAQEKNDSKAVINYAKEAIANLEHFHFFPAPYILGFYLHLLRAAIKLRDFSYCEDVQDEILSKANSLKGINKIFIYQGILELAMHSSRYDVALDIYTKVLKLNVYKKTPPMLKETIDLFAANLYLLKGIGLLEDESSSPISTFRMARFMNSSAISKAKEGANVGFLIVQVIYYLSKKNLEEVIDRVDSIGAYARRNLKNSRSYRSYCFARMIETLPKSDFHLSGVIRRSSKWKKKLDETDFTASDDSLLAEIMPYDLQWEIILSHLEKKHQRGKWKAKYLINQQRQQEGS